MTSTKCLSLWQPWASLMFAPEPWRKHIETRSWSTEYRGLLVIHAARRWSKNHVGPAMRAENDHQTRKYWEKLRPEFGNAIGDILPHPLPLGGYLGVVQLFDCQPTEKIPHLSEIERRHGDYTPGRYGWLCLDAIPFDAPIPGRGFQKLWNAPADVVAAVEALGVKA